MKSVGRILKWATLVAIVVLLFLLTFYPRTTRYGIGDWLKTRTYQLNNEVSDIADSITLTSDGRYTFAATHPEVRDKEDFRTVCPAQSESSVLGCYAYDRIYILRVDEAQLDGVIEVTAAHELLHAEWSRLEDGAREELATELNAAYEANQDNARLVDLIESYRRSNTNNDPDLIPNELHSILATEVSVLSNKLENHYSQFFADRQKVVEFFKNYEDEFARRRARIDEITQQREALNLQINQLNQEIDVLVERNDEIVAEIRRLRDQGQVEESNELVPQQNALARQIRESVNRVNGLVATYNKLVKENNNIALELNDLASSLDATEVDIDG